MTDYDDNISPVSQEQINEINRRLAAIEEFTMPRMVTNDDEPEPIVTVSTPVDRATPKVGDAIDHASMLALPVGAQVIFISSIGNVIWTRIGEREWSNSDTGRRTDWHEFYSFGEKWRILRIGPAPEAAKAAMPVDHATPKVGDTVSADVANAFPIGSRIMHPAWANRSGYFWQRTPDGWIDECGDRVTAKVFCTASEWVVIRIGPGPEFRPVGGIKE